MSEHPSLAEILNVPSARELERIIAAKAVHPSLMDLYDADRAMRFMTTNLRGSYLFARFSVPLYGARVLQTLTKFPPVGDELGTIVQAILEVVQGEVCNNNIFEREGECHSHFIDAVEAYREAGGDMVGLQGFLDLVEEVGLYDAIHTSPFWTEGSRRYARNLQAINEDALALFIFMPVNEALTPKVYARALKFFNTDPRFNAYRTFLQRHVWLDEDDHGPAAMRWLELYIEKTGVDPVRVEEAAAKVVRLLQG